MNKVKQLTAWAKSTPGQIGRIAKALSDANVEITAFTCSSLTGDGPLRLQVNHPDKAGRILQDLGLRVTEEEVLRMTVADRFGTLADIAAKLGEAGINIDYGYGAAAGKTKTADLIFAVSDLEGATRALKGMT